MSKVSMPRPRYIGFTLSGAVPVSRRAFGNALRGRARHEGWADEDGPHLTRFEWPHGIVRIGHAHQARARALLQAITWAQEGQARLELALRTDGASGTLKALTTRVGYLETRGEEGGKPAKPGEPGKPGNAGAKAKPPSSRTAKP